MDFKYKHYLKELWSDNTTWGKFAEGLDLNRLINEIIRIKSVMIDPAFEGVANIDEDQLGQLYKQMKLVTENELGFFPGDQDMFKHLYKEAYDINFFQLALSAIFDTNKGDRSLFASKNLTDIVIEKIKRIKNQKIKSLQAKEHSRVMFAIMDMHLISLPDMIELFPDSDIVIHMTDPLCIKILSHYYASDKRIQVVSNYLNDNLNINMPLGGFDYIFTAPLRMPAGDKLIRMQELIRERIVEALLDTLNNGGEMLAVLPNNITIRDYPRNHDLRSYLMKHSHVSEMIRLDSSAWPVRSEMSTVILHLSKTKLENVSFSRAKITLGKPVIVEIENISYERFEKLSYWDVSSLKISSELEAYNHTSLKKISIGSMIKEIIRGKTILNEHMVNKSGNDEDEKNDGSVQVLNIKDIGGFEIDLQSLDLARLTEVDIEKFHVKEGDLVITVRGSKFRSGIIRKDFDKSIVLSSNLAGLRFKDKLMAEYVNIFFQSRMGLALLESMQRGSINMNINKKDIINMEIPIVGEAVMKKMVYDYSEGELEYFKKSQEIEKKWEETQKQVFEQFY